MSLDVYLTMTGKTTKAEPVIFIRRNGANERITREEWDKLCPGREPLTFAEDETDEVYSANITHNLGGMADAAGVYTCMWRPGEIGITKAAQLIEPLTCGLEVLRSDPEKFKTFNPANGWGDYDGLVRFVENYLEACREYPEADVSASR